VEDRLGTAVVEGGTNAMAYFPYGELRSGTATEVQAGLGLSAPVDQGDVSLGTAAASMGGRSQGGHDGRA
jgi:hypothetical protein